ncbi:MAG TPA: CAP domain-containing protein [Gaiellaceae bacterium]|nr:CAP domain-containing protein [Gaiellaceae bacterium]
MRSLWLLSAAVLAALACGTARAADDPYAALLAPAATCGPASDQLQLDPQAAQLVMLCFTNYARQQSGLAPLTLNATLSAAGNAKLQADVSCGVFSHEPCRQPFETVFAAYTRGASSYEIGENIAWGTGTYGTPRSIMDAWLHSSGHRDNILRPGYREIGIGYLANQTFQGSSGAALWSQQFGVRDAPAAAPSAKPTPAKKKPAVRKRRSQRRRSL